MATLSALIKKYKGDLQSVARISCSTVATKTITRTPVDSGALRASWTPNIGPPIANNVDPGAGGGRNDLASVINRLTVGDTFSLANGQPYARRIEYDAWSPQAPQGMMRRSVIEWRRIVNDAVRQSR